MVRYFYAWIPAVGLSGILLFIVPFLGLIVAAVIALGALAVLGTLVWRIVATLHAFARFVLHSRREPGDAAHREGAAPVNALYREHPQDGLTLTHELR